MFSRLFPWVSAFPLMPYPKRMWWLGTDIGLMYLSFYKRYERAVIEYHKRQLRTLDHDYMFSEASHELVCRREIARKNGIGPMDAEYPDLYDVIDADSLQSKL